MQQQYYSRRSRVKFRKNKSGVRITLKQIKIGILIILFAIAGILGWRDGTEARINEDAYLHISENYFLTYRDVKSGMFDRYSLIKNYRFKGIPTNLNSFHEPNLNYRASAILIAKKIPMKVDEIEAILRFCNERNINPAIVFSLLKQESNFNTYAKNPNSTATGYFQFIKYTGKVFYQKAFNDLNYNHNYMYDSFYSIPVFFEYMTHLQDYCDGKIRRSLQQYYGHPNRQIRAKYANDIINRAYLYCAQLQLVINEEPLYDNAPFILKKKKVEQAKKDWIEI